MTQFSEGLITAAEEVIRIFMWQWHNEKGVEVPVKPGDFDVLIMGQMDVAGGYRSGGPYWNHSVFMPALKRLVDNGAVKFYTDNDDDACYILTAEQ